MKTRCYQDVSVMLQGNGFNSDIFGEGNDPILQFFAAFDMMDQSPAMTAPFRAMAITQLEFMRFWSRRMRAAMHVPAELAGCRTPHEVAAWQQAAVHSAVEDWKACSERISIAWSHAVEQATHAREPGKKSPKAAYRKPHDYIVLPSSEDEREPPCRGQYAGEETAA